jgi:hypothetical protein
VATATAQVRLLTRLTAAELPDTDIEALLELNGGTVKLAAADALEAFAGTLATVESDDMRVDDTRRAATLMARAQRLREQAHADAEDAGFSFDVVFPGTATTAELAES